MRRMNTPSNYPVLSDTQIRRLHHLLDAVSSRIVAVYMQDEMNAREKSDGTLLTDADLQSSDFLRSALPSVLDVPVICEETFSDAQVFRELDTYWLVDPIDGTKGFVQRNGQFCVCVALIHQHVPVVGAIYEPLTQTCWYATHERNSLRKWVNAHDVACPTPTFTAPFVIATGNGQLSSSMKTYLAEQNISDYQHVAKGSALKFTDVVDGYNDLYVKMSTTSEWDTAAGQVIVESIGGCVLDDSGKPLRYGERNTVVNPNFVACSPTMSTAQVEKAWQALPKATSPLSS